MIRTGKLILATALVAATVGATTKAAAQASENTTLSLQVSGEVVGVPDIAQVQAGVVTDGADAATALAANNKAMARVVAALKKNGIASRDIQTSRVSLQPRYVHVPNQEPKLTGFQATNQVQLRLRDVSKAGAVLDALVAEGANQIQGPDFSFDKPEPLLDEARSKAVKTAMARAKLYADAAGLRVARVVKIDEQGGYRPPMPIARMAAAPEMAKADSTPFEAGEASVSVQLSVTFELSGR